VYSAAESSEVGTGRTAAIPKKASEAGWLLVNLTLASVSRPMFSVKQMS
jgi:hypothetical protein